ncbi:hypothetical protein MmiAt1_15000 [Methanimicrococcus sp. At1]|uniref:Uncharacterized protein n=1 Tax=Methanimicrococcus hacksteinii TaxID=3028293 RepID=A0ABU3VRH1_9EURY|nr:hypothetical protein [Methanimicrococcus sp. At1]MDV0445899.1 hypothetical protein [Methanimicrococcus sp. At1]
MLNRELQSAERVKVKLSGIDPQALVSFEMGNDDIDLICTYGKITLLCRSEIPDYTIGLILKTISAVDNSTSHETEILCDFDDIQNYQRMGYTLVSYGRCSDQYRVAFNIPFSSEKAVYNLTIALFDELSKEKTLKKDFYWSGKDHNIIQLFNELKDINGWKVKTIKNKDI